MRSRDFFFFFGGIFWEGYKSFPNHQRDDYPLSQELPSDPPATSQRPGGVHALHPGRPPGSYPAANRADAK